MDYIHIMFAKTPLRKIEEYSLYLFSVHLHIVVHFYLWMVVSYPASADKAWKIL